MPADNPDTDQLLAQVSAGDESAAQQLLARHRPRLRRMVAVHLDTRISARVDPSDVVQEALAEAYQRLPEYLQERPVSSYPWLRQIAWQRLVKLHRAHISARRRSVRREDDASMRLPDESMLELAECLASTVYSVGCERGVHYYAMDYVEGPTLADVVGQLRAESKEHDSLPLPLGEGRGEGISDSGVEEQRRSGGVEECSSGVEQHGIDSSTTPLPLFFTRLLHYSTTPLLHSRSSADTAPLAALGLAALAYLASRRRQSYSRRR